MDRIALISDIHGNIPALEAILLDIKQREVQRTYCLGDLVGKGPYSDKAVDVCRAHCEKTIKGNWDDAIVRGFDGPMAHWHRQRLGQERLDYLERLPDTIEFHMSGRKVRLFHASQVGIYYRVFMTDPVEKHLAMFSNTDFTGYAFEPDVVGYGDVHNAFLKNYRRRTLFNVGSVGNPLDQTLASYVILEGHYGSERMDAFSIHLLRIPYDVELAIKQARDEQMPELEPYENELRTGRYRGAVSPG